MWYTLVTRNTLIKMPYQNMDFKMSLQEISNYNTKKKAQRRTAVTGEFSTKRHIFPPNAQNLFFIISIILVGKKYTKMIGHMPWLYQ